MKEFKPKGTITALVTPFKKDGSVDFDGISNLIDYQIENGIDSIVVCGSTGESATLTSKEKQAIIIHSVEYSAGRIPIIAGTGTYETEATLAMTLFAKEHGADAALIVAPYYNKPPQDGIFEHFKMISSNVDIPIILYNIPGRTGVNVSAKTQLKIAEQCPNVIATKEASGDLEQMMEIIKNSPNNFSLLCGDDSFSIPTISIGAKGTISVISNYAPKLFSQMINFALDSKIKEANEIHYKLFDLMMLNFVESNPVPCKYIMSVLGLCSDRIRLPLFPLKNENKEKIKQTIIDTGILIPKKSSNKKITGKK